MLQEKSCGALVYRVRDGIYELLLIKHRRGGHWSFPKGHTEPGESEQQTALREIAEETGLGVTLEPSFRHCVEYYPKPNIKKRVVYFLGAANPVQRVCPQEEEISEFCWSTFSKANALVSFRNDKNLISQADTYLRKRGHSIK